MLRLDVVADDYVAQLDGVLAWLDGLPPDVFERASVLDGWDVRTLVGHLLMMHTGLLARLETREDAAPLAVSEYVRRYAAVREEIADQTIAVVDGRNATALIAALRESADLRQAVIGVGERTVLQASRGPITAIDWVTTRLVDLVVHTDDLSRSLPEIDAAPIQRAALATTTRTLAEILAAKAPGRTVELRIPPFVAVQAVAGPRHTRGTPANVIEMDALTWLRLATGRVSWAKSLASVHVRASGTRADLTAYLPLLS